MSRWAAVRREFLRLSDRMWRWRLYAVAATLAAAAVGYAVSICF